MPCSCAVERVGNRRYQHLEVAPMVVCKGSAHLDTFFQEIIDSGGEGIILRDPKARLTPGRSPGYLKHKASLFLMYSLLIGCQQKFRDAEAKVIGSAGALQWECELYASPSHPCYDSPLTSPDQTVSDSWLLLAPLDLPKGGIPNLGTL